MQVSCSFSNSLLLAIWGFITGSVVWFIALPRLAELSTCFGVNKEIKCLLLDLSRARHPWHLISLFMWPQGSKCSSGKVSWFDIQLVWGFYTGFEGHNKKMGLLCLEEASWLTQILGMMDRKMSHWRIQIVFDLKHTHPPPQIMWMFSVPGWEIISSVIVIQRFSQIDIDCSVPG